MRKALRQLALGAIGGILYAGIELAWRGRTHPSMLPVGGLCFVLIGGVNNWFPWELGILWQALIGSAAVTAVELAAGCALNLWLGLGVWDYSALPLNFLGQICLPFSAAWVGLAAVGILLDDLLRYKLFGERWPGYKVF